VLKERDTCGGHRDNLLRRHIHVIDLLRRHLREAVATRHQSHRHQFHVDPALGIQRGIRLGDHHALFLVRGEVIDNVRRNRLDADDLDPRILQRRHIVSCQLRALLQNDLV